MEREHLKQRLEELHAQLRAGGEIDAETQGLLQQLADDIDALLLTVEAPQGDDQSSRESERQSLLDRLMAVGSEFEESHPTLAATIGRVANALSNIGI